MLQNIYTSSYRLLALVFLLGFGCLSLSAQTTGNDSTNQQTNGGSGVIIIIEDIPYRIPATTQRDLHLFPSVVQAGGSVRVVSAQSALTVQVVSATGQTVYRHQPYKQEFILRTDTLVGGVYWVQVDYGEGIRETAKFVVQ